MSILLFLYSCNILIQRIMVLFIQRLFVSPKTNRDRYSVIRVLMIRMAIEILVQAVNSVKIEISYTALCYIVKIGVIGYSHALNST